MGASNSLAFSFDQISQACLSIGLNKPKTGFCVNYVNTILPNLYTSTSYLCRQKIILNEPEYLSVLSNSIVANFNAFDITATIQNTSGFKLNGISIENHFKPTDSIDCNMQVTYNKIPVYSMVASYVSRYINGSFNLMTANKFNQYAYKITSGFAVNDILHFGLGISKEEQDLPHKILTAGFINLGALQFSTSFDKSLAKDGNWSYTFGTNLLLDPVHIINLGFQTNQKEFGAAIGYFCHIKDYEMNSTISTDGEFTTRLSKQISDNIQLDTGVSLILGTLTVSPSIDIRISS